MDINNERDIEKWEAQFFGNDNGELVEMDLTEVSNKVQYSKKTNSAMFGIFFNYINFKLNNPEYNTEEYDGLYISHVISGVEFMGNIADPAPTIVNYDVLCTVNGVDILINFESYVDGGELKHWVFIHSKDKLGISGSKLYTNILNSALSKSNLKGSYFSMPNNEFSWTTMELAELSYDDIFLPKDLMDNAKLFVELFKNKNLMSRYMLSGIPGTGKTELTRVLSSILNKDGVTIIKTNPCEKLKEKVELAKVLAPAIIIMDDIDLYLGNRNNGSYSTLLGQFLDVLDGVDKLPDDVGIIASTNAPHLIDLAAQRPGRFDKMMFFDTLTKQNIKGIIKKSLKNLTLKYGPIDKEIEDKLLSDTLVDYFKKSEETGSYVYQTVVSIKNKMDVMGETDLSIEELVKSLRKERKLLKEKLNTTEIKSNFDGERKSMGFN